MLRNAVSKAMWVGRTTATVIGLAIALAIVFGVATMALAAVPGDPFKLGKVNSINRLSTLVGTATSPILRVQNKGTGTALDLRVQTGKPPLTTNSIGRVPRLNADMVDGKHAGAFLPKNGKAADSAKLEGKAANEFLGADQKATDSEKLDNLDSTDFQRANAAAGGDLTGNYPSPQIASGAVGTPNFGPIPTVRATSGGNTTVPDRQFVTLTFGGTTHDVGDLWGSANPSRLTAPVDGVYLVSAEAVFSTNETGYRLVRIVKNGGAFVANHQASATPGVGTVHPISTQAKLSAGDYVEVIVQQNSGQDLTVFGSNRHFEMTWIAPG